VHSTLFEFPKCVFERATLSVIFIYGYESNLRVSSCGGHIRLDNGPPRAPHGATGGLNTPLTITGIMKHEGFFALYQGPRLYPTASPSRQARGLGGGSPPQPQRVLRPSSLPPRLPLHHHQGHHLLKHHRGHLLNQTAIRDPLGRIEATSTVIPT